MARSVVVVDDNDSFRAMTVRIVESWGQRVVGQAASASEAVERVSALRPDTVIADITLPDVDGLELTRTLIALPWPVRVFLISSDGDETWDSLAESAGASGFCTKADIFSARFRAAIERA